MILRILLPPALFPRPVMLKEIDDFDVAQVERTAEDRRGFEAVDLAEGWDQALVFGSDADPLPRFQSVCELLGREGSRQFHRMTISVPAAVLTKPSGRGSTPGAV
jgi:hypothetical protein